MRPKPPKRMFAVVKIDGTTLPAPEFHEWKTSLSYLKAKVAAGVQGLEFVLCPGWKNAHYCTWSSKKPKLYAKVRGETSPEQKKLMALVAKGPPPAAPRGPAKAPKRPSSKQQDRINVWLVGRP